MHRYVYKSLNVLIMTFLSCGVISGGMLFVICFVVLCNFLYKGNIDKVYEFLPVVLITPFVIYLLFKIGNMWRTKTIKLRDEGDKTWMD